MESAPRKPIGGEGHRFLITQAMRSASRLAAWTSMPTSLPRHGRERQSLIRLTYVPA